MRTKRDAANGTNVDGGIARLRGIGEPPSVSILGHAPEAVKGDEGQSVCPYITPDETARLLGLTRTRCYQLLRNGTIPNARLGESYVIHRAEVLYYREHGRTYSSLQTMLHDLLGQLRSLTAVADKLLSGDVDLVVSARPRKGE